MKMKLFFHDQYSRTGKTYLPGCLLSLIIIIIVMFVLVMTVLTSFGQTSGIQIAKVGAWHDWQVKIKPHQQWFGLFENEKRNFRLEKVRLNVEDIYDEDVDSNNEKTGKLVSIQNRRSTIILVAGIEHMKEGEIIGRNHNRRILAPDRLVEIDLFGTCYTLSSFGLPEHGVTMDTEQQYYDYGISLINNNMSQLILKDHYFYGNGPSLVWSGDLDRDGQLDLLIDCICEDTSTNMALFLSSLSEENELVKLVAIWKSE